MTHTTQLHANPFNLLAVSSRDNRHTIVEKAEERALHLDHDLCQQARAELTNPKSRLLAEMAWLPGVAPSAAQKLIDNLARAPMDIRTSGRLPTLAQANLFAAAAELLGEKYDSRLITEFILDFADVVDKVDLDVVLRDINEDRVIAGFPEIRGLEFLKEGLTARRKAYRGVLKGLLDSFESDKLVTIMTDVVALATEDGDSHAPSLIDELVDAYEVETQTFLTQEAENIDKLIGRIQEAATRGAYAVDPLLDKLEQVARNWDSVAQPIQVSAKSRGTDHEPSTEIAQSMRSLGIALFNEHEMLEQAQRMTALLQELFAELPEVVERLEADAETLDDLWEQARQAESARAQQVRDITFSAKIGMLVKDELSIGPEGITWKGSTYSLEDITRIRYGGISNSVNGIPTGTNYTIGFGTLRRSEVIELRKTPTYTGFVSTLWKAVGPQIMIDLLQKLRSGEQYRFGSITVKDNGVILYRHRFLVSNEQVSVGWDDVEVWSANGQFVIGKKGDKKVYGMSSYIEEWNTHALEQVVRLGFKKGVSRLSDVLSN
ncbi:hypothetical protein LE190_10925 [Massilia oculi]|uniref:Uncharacterized protein n=1 Tax=Massilia hydrophila TaxID=3044279 RepID=A0ABS7YD23_9BURK|nr:hypothetical protein [Massilia oculi]MCA1856429.1 hypothetical protein [Massilia oculi]